MAKNTHMSNKSKNGLWVFQGVLYLLFAVGDVGRVVQEALIEILLCWRKRIWIEWMGYNLIEQNTCKKTTWNPLQPSWLVLSFKTWTWPGFGLESGITKRQHRALASTTPSQNGSPPNSKNVCMCVLKDILALTLKNKWGFQPTSPLGQRAENR